MLNDSGYNPMRWDCATRGCFNKKCRPKIEMFCDVLPGRISFGDVDGLVEINGHFLLLEWKSSSLKPIPKGQEILYKRLTLDERFTVIVVYGDAETMSVTGMLAVSGGKFSAWNSSSLNEVRSFISHWSRESLKSVKASMN